MSHAASSYYFSGYSEAAILTVDGVGEWATTTYGVAEDLKIDLFEQVNYPDSLGLFYAAFTSYLGFQVNSGEYKVMGLAPYGKPIYADIIRNWIEIGLKGQYVLSNQHFSFSGTSKMFTSLWEEELGLPARVAETEISQPYRDLARSVQVVLEEILINKANYLYNITEKKNLCMAGGVALNCVANGKVLKQTPFEHLFVQPAANDAGSALGAAALAHVEVTGETPRRKPLPHVFLGSRFETNQVRHLLTSSGLIFHDFENDPDEMVLTVARRLKRGQVVGWHQGAMEFGPRALGGRSILADPRNAQMRDKINEMVKKREMFRPFAPSVLESHASEHFEMKDHSPFMLNTFQVTSDLDLPAITHVDRSARVQTINESQHFKYARLIQAFYDLTGCPILLNTSFNVRGQPIVHTPEDSLSCFLVSQLDCLAIEDFLVEKPQDDHAYRVLLKSYQNFKQSDLPADVYTFL